MAISDMSSPMIRSYSNTAFAATFLNTVERQVLCRGRDYAEWRGGCVGGGGGRGDAFGIITGS